MYCSMPGLFPPLQVDEPNWLGHSGEISKKVSKASVALVFTPHDAELITIDAAVGAETP